MKKETVDKAKGTRKSILYLILMVFLFLSCDVSKPSSGNSTKITLNIDESEKLSYSDVIKGIEYLQLKIPKDEFIGNIGKVFFTEEYIGIVDRRKRSVWIFDEGGNFINKIPVKIGKGPGEVLSFSDADFGDGKEIHVLGAYRINTFNFKGELVNEVQLPFLTRSFKYLNNQGSYIAFMNNEIAASKGDQKNGFFNLYTFDSEGKIINRFLPFEQEKTDLTRLLISNFYILNGELHHYSFLDNNIYKVSLSDIEIKYKLNYGENKIPEKLFERKPQYQTGLAFLREEVYTKDYVLLNTAMETQKHLVAGVSYGNKRGYLFYNKKTKETLLTTVSDFRNDFIPELDIYFHLSFNDHIYGIISSSELSEKINSVEDLDESQLGEIAEEISRNNGPVLIKAKLK